MKLRHLAVAAFTMMMVVLTSGMAVAASLVLPSDVHAATHCGRVLETSYNTIGEPPYDRLTLSMAIPYCFDGKQAWIEPNKKIQCEIYGVIRGTVRGKATITRCEPNGQEYYQKTVALDAFYEIDEATPRGEAFYQVSIMLYPSGKWSNEVSNFLPPV